MSAIATIRNLGPATEAAFLRAGLTSAEEVHAIGPDAAYLIWLKAGEPAHFIGYYALVLGLQGRPWTDCSPDEKKALRLRFDMLKAEAAQGKGAMQSQFEAALNILGVVEKRR